MNKAGQKIGKVLNSERKNKDAWRTYHHSHKPLCIFKLQKMNSRELKIFIKKEAMA
jgi:hypothetical protein